MATDASRGRVARMVGAYNDFLKSVPFVILPGVVQPLTPEKVAEVGPWMGRMAQQARTNVKRPESQRPDAPVRPAHPTEEREQMTGHPEITAPWRKSVRSAVDEACVEVAPIERARACPVDLDHGFR